MPKIEYLIVDHLSIKELTRIFSKIVVNPVTQCWEWTSAFDSHGYSLVWYKGANERVHRLLYAWAVKPIPKGRRKGIPVLDHIICDNPPCCNPSHVRLCQNRDNVLRGNGTSANNARKTHCKRGHPLPPKELNRNQRECKICKAEAARLRRTVGPNSKLIRQKERENARRYYWATKATPSPT
jgi:hypothetical protein